MRSGPAQDSWGVSGATFTTFTLGTLAVIVIVIVIVIVSVAGYLNGRLVRTDEVAVAV
ncbi:MAG TPA: hypothetical protein VFN55_05115 [Solirubrobacteraceae bacterium]|nr:hypothetical protein [Solirubrobacteraceae bacterium]